MKLSFSTYTLHLSSYLSIVLTKKGMNDVYKGTNDILYTLLFLLKRYNIHWSILSHLKGVYNESKKDL